MLAESYKSLKMNTLIPSRAGGTRWATHQLRAVDVVLNGFPAIVSHLSQVKNIFRALIVIY